MDQNATTAMLHGANPSKWILCHLLEGAGGGVGLVGWWEGGMGGADDSGRMSAGRCRLAAVVWNDDG